MIEKRDTIRPPSATKTKIAGYAAVYYDPADPGTEYRGAWGIERIMPGALADVLTQREDIVALFNHNLDSVLGRRSAATLKLSLDARGLKYDVKPGKAGRRVLDMVARGDVVGSSFSFDQAISRTGADGAREITRIGRVYDVGPVVFPAYEATTADVRSYEDDLYRRIVEMRNYDLASLRRLPS